MLIFYILFAVCILFIGGGVMLVEYYDPYVKNHTDNQKMLIHKMNVKNGTVPEIDLSSMPKPRKIEVVPAPLPIVTVEATVDKNEEEEVTDKIRKTLSEKPQFKMVTKQRKVVCPHCLGTKNEDDECPYCGIG